MMLTQTRHIMSRGKYAERANVNICCERSQAHALAYFPKFRAVSVANKRNEGVTRATFRSALMSERISCVTRIVV